MQIASDMAMALNEMKDAIRSQIKYTDKHADYEISASIEESSEDKYVLLA